MSIFHKTENTGAPTPNSNLPSPSVKEQEQKAEAAEKAAKDAAAKAAKTPLDAHGNPMPDLNAPAREAAK
jgi:hypothetical protein